MNIFVFRCQFIFKIQKLHIFFAFQGIFETILRKNLVHNGIWIMKGENYNFLSRYKITWKKLCSKQSNDFSLFPTSNILPCIYLCSLFLSKNVLVTCFWNATSTSHYLLPSVSFASSLTKAISIFHGAQACFYMTAFFYLELKHFRFAGQSVVCLYSERTDFSGYYDTPTVKVTNQE